MYTQNVRTERPSRLIGAILAAALQLALVVVVWTGFSPQIVRGGAQSALTSLDLRPPPTPPPPPRSRPRRPAHAASGRAAPPHARAHATPVVAPPVPPLKPVPIVAAKVAGTGAQSAQGAALAGQGSGAGGEGQGAGSGGAGNGEGGGGQGGGGDGAELIRGEIKNSDIPQSLRSAPFSGTTRATIAVDANGRVSGCRLARSSGNSLLDDLTCRLIFQRFRFQPARGDQGRPEPDTIDYDQEWTITGKFGDLQGGQ